MCVRVEGQRKPFDPKQKLISSCRASVEHYSNSNEPTDTASSGTSSELEELCNSAEEKLDREVSLRVTAAEKMNEQDSGVLDRGRRFYSR